MTVRFWKCVFLPVFVLTLLCSLLLQPNTRSEKTSLDTLSLQKGGRVLCVGGLFF